MSHEHVWSRKKYPFAAVATGVLAQAIVEKCSCGEVKTKIVPTPWGQREWSAGRWRL